MSDAAKPDPTTAAPAEEKKEEKPTTTTEETKPETEKPAAPKTTDSVFAMFGGGPKKEKKQEEESQEAKDEPSGSAKAQKEGEEVCLLFVFIMWIWWGLVLGVCWMWRWIDLQPLSHIYGWLTSPVHHCFHMWLDIC